MTSNNNKKDATALLKATIARRCREGTVQSSIAFPNKRTADPRLRNLQLDLNVEVLDKHDYYRAKVERAKEEKERKLRLDAEREAKAREAYEISLNEVKASKGFFERWPNAERGVYYAINTNDIARPSSNNRLARAVALDEDDDDPNAIWIF